MFLVKIEDFKLLTLLHSPFNKLFYIMKIEYLIALRNDVPPTDVRSRSKLYKLLHSEEVSLSCMLIAYIKWCVLNVELIMCCFHSMYPFACTRNSLTVCNIRSAIIALFCNAKINAPISNGVVPLTEALIRSINNCFSSAVK